MDLRSRWNFPKSNLPFFIAMLFFCLLVFTTVLTGQAEISPFPFGTKPGPANNPVSVEAPPAKETAPVRQETASVGSPNPMEEIVLGEFQIAAYCGSEGSKTYSGTIPAQGRTIAANLELFQIGDILKIDDQIYYVEDKVSSTAKEQLRLYFDSEEEALSYGRQTRSVSRIILPSEDKESLWGVFEVTGYCSCEICCGIKDVSLTKTETIPRAGHTVAADPEVIPLGTKILIDGITYTVEDTGKAIKGNIIDIFFDTHQEAVDFGRQQKKVYRVKEEGPSVIINPGG